MCNLYKYTSTHVDMRGPTSFTLIYNERSTKTFAVVLKGGKYTKTTFKTLKNDSIF